ncbi:hypothetical protein [Pontibacter fetidus]|uniref:Uncharacterized protein n=1 Tax=Pontibacter fetidus TaxID=2700082 RepID=A0A6B2GXS0_9BACT|nr:hypothetical protein [Pontibacter fetidus]NDK55749.1 hypothetical protein [Pontibacter fetidus]
MKKSYLLLLLLLQLANTGRTQSAKPDTISFTTYFKEIETATKKHRQLWNMDLYTSILIVDPQTRKIVANEADTAGILTGSADRFTGYLPPQVNVANTALHWGGKHWAMLLLPLPQDKHERINLLAHELFHKTQPSLGFALHNAANNHLDEKNGRIYLRLELEALKKALQASPDRERKQYLTHAFTFRKYRHQLYPDADSTENLLELNEGLAEYTGFVISERSRKQAVVHFENSINSFQQNPTFVRSFAYHTIPVYGYLLSSRNKYWNKKISPDTDLTSYFIDAFEIEVPQDLRHEAERIAADYNGRQIMAEETKRAVEKRKLVAEYKSKFVEQPHVELYFEKMNVSFDPRNMMPLEDKGTVYPTIRVTDNWGILTVENGALMSPDWKKISLTLPTELNGNKISGDGWTLELNESYTLTMNSSSGNYILSKKK